ncbi:hypothetical protein IEQ34_011108 [Dendrobium chrysotoxum]|uniref:Auxin-responsive protein n=1 Tax=Dendrobium chrysotoxum TaxID=161865 RepID=A0AAV7GYW7_DENCH|nr:hypothetical protein IEQ34_011108 [Dendrobium chrysotoxum]
MHSQSYERNFQCNGVLSGFLKQNSALMNSKPLSSSSSASLKSFQEINQLNKAATPKRQSILGYVPKDECKKPKIGATYRLFGIDLIKPSSFSSLSEKNPSSETTEEPQVLISPTAEPLDQHSEQKISTKLQKTELVSPKEIQSKHSGSTRSRIKVHMHGVAVGRAMDIMKLRGYDELISELDKMFEIKGELSPRDKWEVVFTDDEGDLITSISHSSIKCLAIEYKCFVLGFEISIQHTRLKGGNFI